MPMRLSESQLERFLLGSLAEEERVEIEDLALRDEEAFDLLEAMETDLVDRYVRQELSAADRLAFEQRLAPLPRIHQRIAHARLLAVAADHGAEAPASRRGGSGALGRRLALRRLLAVAATVLAVTIGTLLVHQARLASWPERAGDAAPPTSEPAVTYALSPGALRDATAGQLVERAGQSWIGLGLDLRHPAVRPAATADVEVVLESAARGKAITRRRVTADELARGTLTWFLRANDLPPGDYTILLQEHIAGPPAEARVLANYEITVR